MERLNELNKPMFGMVSPHDTCTNDTYTFRQAKIRGLLVGNLKRLVEVCAVKTVYQMCKDGAKYHPCLVLIKPAWLEFFLVNEYLPSR